MTVGRLPTRTTDCSIQSSPMSSITDPSQGGEEANASTSTAVRPDIRVATGRIRTARSGGRRRPVPGTVRFSIHRSTAPMAGLGLHSVTGARRGELLGHYVGDELGSSARGNYIFERADGVCIDGSPRAPRDYERMFSYVNVSLWDSEQANARMDGDGRIFATRRIRAGEEIFFASYGPDYDWRSVQRALAERALRAARSILANSISDTAAQIRRMTLEPYLYDLVRNRSPLNDGSSGLRPLERESPREWFVRAFAHPVFGAYCTFRRAGAPGERRPVWSSLMSAPVSANTYNLRRSLRTRSYAEEEQAIDLSGSVMLAEGSHSPGVTVDADSYLGEDSDLLNEDGEEEEDEECMG
jgi:hypothetical protein